MSKRLFDVAASVLLIAILALPLAVLAILVRWQLGSPVLFTHERPGRGGRPSRILRFRTMTGGRDAEGRLLPDGERLGTLGRFLRVTSLDKLPELINVARGEMSLVGPRPLLMEYLPLNSAEQAHRAKYRGASVGSIGHVSAWSFCQDKIIAMYARGMTVREIQAFPMEMYATEVTPEFISTVTDAVFAEVTAWQARPLETMYPVIFFDALWVKIREDNVVRNKAVYLALGVRPEGTREILGLWIENTEGAKFWMKVFNDLKTRGLADILIAVTDGLMGMAEALAVAYPAATLQTCNRAPDQEQPGLRELEGPQGTGRGDQAGLHGPQCGSRRDRARYVRVRTVGSEIPDRGRVLVPRLGEHDAVLCVSAAGAPRDLHHQRDREPERADAQDHRNARTFPVRRRCEQTDLAGVAQHHRPLEPCGARLEGRNQPIRNPLSRALYAAADVRCYGAPTFPPPQTQKSGYTPPARYPDGPACPRNFSDHPRSPATSGRDPTGKIACQQAGSISTAPCSDTPLPSP